MCMARGTERDQAVEVEVRAALGALDDVVDLERAPAAPAGAPRKTTRLIAAPFTLPRCALAAG